jgi:hypothetical protein
MVENGRSPVAAGEPSLLKYISAKHTSTFGNGDSCHITEKIARVAINNQTYPSV